MSETQALLNRISALRQRLEQAHKSGHDGATLGSADRPDAPGLARLWELERQVNAGAEQARTLEALTPPPAAASESSRPMPSQLTARARKVLERGRELLQALRTLQQDPLVHEPGGLLTALYRETSTLCEAALRLVTQLPDSATLQLQQSEGIEALLNSVAQRLGSLAFTLRRQREETQRLIFLTESLDRLDAGSPIDLSTLTLLAETLLGEANECVGLRFHHPPEPAADRPWVLRFVAGHCLTTAEVMARLVRHDPELKSKAVEAVLSALVHDVGMVRLPAELLASTVELDADQRRDLERHCRLGGEMIAQALPGSLGALEATVHHHERSDGTGYPDGLQQGQLSPLTRLLAVCDVYAAGCQARPHRLPRDTRTALTDTLLLAEQGKLDRHCAERLLHLSFYPVGSVVEMADGALAAVVAASNLHDLQAPARPVVAVLTDPQGRLLPTLHYLDLSHSGHHSVVRSLLPAERRQCLGTRYPEWAL